MYIVCASDKPEYVTWGVEYLGILLDRTVDDLAWSLITDTPVKLNDLNYTNLIAMVQKMDGINRFVYVYVKQYCYKILVTAEMSLFISKVY